ncbi:tetratricopeptide repeat protein [Marivirga harenae]|uniref:tetratricopeptide repeat protein n=1 Tax=Marivirga harenae TaxID=2010992 RepID=UPI0026E0C5BF|nr:tetratricopeptide repeat protein [Marivirga harenae]WKV11225.1 tetratricopeptide repeat protein [Marivirga harenae]|tara:strand:- start:105633 stop:107669 length:2037 start_codon:yes stop_codon:yes gene_type:complete
MLVRIVIFLFFVFPAISFANDQTDSLKNVLKAEIADSTRVNIYKDLLYNMSTSEPSQAIFYGQLGLDLARKIEDVYSEIQLLNNLGISYYGLGAYEKTLEYFLKVLELEKELDNLPSLSRAMNNVGIIYDEIGRLDKSADYYEESLKLKESFQDSLGISTTMSNLGLLYLKMEKPEKAIQYFRKCYLIDKRLNDPVGIYNSLHNIGIYHKDFGDQDSAVYYIEKALLAVPKGEKHFDKTYIVKSLAQSYLRVKDYDKASKYFQRAVNSAIEVEALDVLRESYKGLSEIYENNAQFEKSLSAYKKYKALNDSIFNQDFNSKVSQLEKNFEIQSKEKEIQLLTNKAEITSLQLTRREYTNYFLIALGIMLAVVAFISYNRFQIKNKSHKVLQLKNEEINLQKSEIKENRDEIAAQRDNILDQKHALEEASSEIMKSIWYAQHIQQAILPDLNQIKSVFHEFFMLYMPKSIVSGDFYWFTKKDDKIFFALADCTGHGIPGAFMTVMANDLLNSIVIQQDEHDCANILNLLDEAVLSSLQYKGNSSNDGLDIALFCIDSKSRELTFSGAGIDMLVFQKEEWRTYKGERFSIGGFKESEFKNARNKKLNLEDDAQIYFYTDGYVDQFGGKEDKKFMRKRLSLILDDIKLLPFEQQKLKLEKAITEWKSDREQTDDISFTGIRI